MEATNLTLQDGVADQRHLFDLFSDVLPQFTQDLVKDDELTNQSLHVVTEDGADVAAR